MKERKRRSEKELSLTKESLIKDKWKSFAEDSLERKEKFFIWGKVVVHDKETKKQQTKFILKQKKAKLNPRW